jgi:hypothetical protein
MKPKQSANTNPYGASSNLITWTGSDIPCLGIKNGDVLSEAVHVIACKVCAIADSLDLSSTDLSCLIAKPNVKPEDKNVKLILQLLLDNQCTLKTLIDAATSRSEDSTLNINMKCLKIFDAFQNEIPQDLPTTLQSLVNQVCTNTTDIALLKVKTTDLQTQISAINLTPPIPDERIVTNCLSTAQPISQALNQLAADYCVNKSVIGSASQLQGAIAKQCTGLNTRYGDQVGWNSTPVNLAQTLQNLWIAFCDVSNRLSAMETTCCAPSCDKIKLGFTPEFDFAAKSLNMIFESGAGTNIPLGFADCGTVLSITDHTGYVKTFSNLKITMGGETLINLSGVAQGKLAFNFKTKFCLKDETGTTIMTCSDCVEQSIDYFDSSCCLITNTSAATVTIAYDSCSATSNA